MSRISDHISVSDSFTVLLDDSLKENQSLREQLRQRDEENALKCEELSNKADSSCKLVAENNSGSKETKSKKGNSKVHVPTSVAKPMRYFVYLCKNIYIYDICIFQFFSCENYKIKLKSYKTRVVIYGSVLERHVRHRFTEA